MIPIRLIAALVIFSIQCCSCVSASDEANDRRGPITPVAVVGKMSESEVETVRLRLEKITFPQPAETVSKMIPPDIVPDPVEHIDLFSTDSKGRMGGRVQDYWLNSRVVLRVAQAYYYIDEKPESKDEWAVVLLVEELDRFQRQVLE
jgi:hypothetical protein